MIAADLSRPAPPRNSPRTRPAGPRDRCADQQCRPRRGSAGSTMRPGALKEMLQVNIVALTELTRLLLPGMIARGRGWIMLVGRSPDFSPVPAWRSISPARRMC